MDLMSLHVPDYNMGILCRGFGYIFLSHIIWVLFSFFEVSLDFQALSKEDKINKKINTTADRISLHVFFLAPLISLPHFNVIFLQK